MKLHTTNVSGTRIVYRVIGRVRRPHRAAMNWRSGFMVNLRVVR
jgi:hypothetical protein